MSNFVIIGSPADYYHELKEDDGTTRYIADRPMIRRYAQELHEYHTDLISGGGDIYTSSLDESDKFKNFIRSEPLDAQIEIFNVLAEEAEAIASKVNDQTNDIYNEAAKKEADANYAGQIIGGIVLFFVVLLFLFNA
ncbi:hypothetical protein [Pectobacterium parmentieri]|uniref:hypothetical protein n=1 Tax=Pectobacterium parmentieri TaxID=1905730 RepID=UPI0018E03221|nr:hypothetical protein [Pectobacterium parmentieri]MBI0429668.1 hypothetical protein [Pectobacterium parmentieri]